eukprot:363614-Chlamydomonas_euryale.AAC.9
MGWSQQKGGEGMPAWPTIRWSQHNRRVGRESMPHSRPFCGPRKSGGVRRACLHDHSLVGTGLDGAYRWHTSAQHLAPVGDLTYSTFHLELQPRDDLRAVVADRCSSLCKADLRRPRQHARACVGGVGVGGWCG